jgi:hypothetical protein
MGDALLAYWPGDVNGLGCAVRAASACAADICESHTIPLDGTRTESEPAFRIGVGAGNFWAAALGGNPRWNLVVGGEAIFQAACAQKKAHCWECRLSDTAQRANAGGVEEPLQLQRSTASTQSVADDKWLAGFLLPELREAVYGIDSNIADNQSTIGHLPIAEERTSASLDRLAEIRPITALFARFGGLDPHEAQALERHQALCFALQENLRSRGAPVGELAYDDKGLTFVTVLGERGSFHRDDPSRAVDAACALVEAAEGLHLSSSVGIATGDAIFRVVGNAHRHQRIVVGTPMNRAARLMTATSTSILCDAPTERASRTTFLFEPRGTLQLVGLGDTAAVFRPVERRSFTASRVALVGRRRELQLLKRGLDEATGGGTGIVVVAGEPGIGKTTLVQCFADELRLNGRPLYEAPAAREDRRTSLLPWRRVVASLLNLTTDVDGSTLLEAAATRFEDNPSILRRLPLLDALLGITVHQSEGTRHLQGRHRADATMRLLAEIIQVLAPQPLVIILEDSQWFDSASWRLCEWMLASMSSLLLIACVRSEEVPDELKSLNQRVGDGRKRREPASQEHANFCHFLELEELNEGSISEIVTRTLADVPAVHSDISVRINELAGGNPLFAEEIALSLRGSGLIAIRDGLWRPLRQLEACQHFEGLERVIRERVDRLKTSCQNVLKAAAVVGRSFTLSALESLLNDDMPLDELSIALESVVAARLIRRSTRLRTYEFRHDQIRDVIYGSIPSDIRNRLHEKLAKTIEMTEPEGVRDNAPLLARHFEACGNNEKALEYADLAATKAIQQGAFREAKAFLEMCLTREPWKQPSTAVQKLQAVRWRRQLAEVHYNIGDLHAQNLCVREALALAGEPAPSSYTKLCFRLIRDVTKLAFQQIYPPKTFSNNNPIDSWEQELTRCLGQAAIGDYFQLRFSSSFYHLIAAAVHGERTGMTAEMLLTSAQLACGLGILGHSRLARYFMSRAERGVSVLRDPAIHSQICIVDALWRIGRCDWPMVDKRIDDAQKLSLAAEDQLRWCNAQAIRFWSLYYRGDLVALEHAAQELLTRAQSSGNFQQELWALRCKALYLLHTGSALEAVDILRLNASTHSESEDIAEQVSATGLLALALARSGRHPESVQAAIKTLDLLRGIGRPTVHTIIVGIAGMAEVIMRGRESGISGEYDEWHQWEQQALYELNRFRRAFPLGDTQYGLWLGVTHWLKGHNARAMSTWNQALATARSRSLRRDEAMIAAEIRRRTDQPSRAIA